MKLTEKELDLMVSDILIYHEHFLIFEKKINFPKKTSFEQKLRLFNSIYQTCEVRETNKQKPKTNVQNKTNRRD